MFRAHIVTLFPGMCEAYFQHSILARAIEKRIIEVCYYNPIDEVPTVKRVDGRQYGGGPGMVLKAEPYLKCFDKTKQYTGTRKTVFLTPGGALFTQKKAKEYADFENLILFCGHYEGIDERVADATDADRISVGSYILTGGELPALSIIDATAREIPDVLGNAESCEDTRIAGQKVYTRPEYFEYEGIKYRVPSVLLSGHHQKIDEYRNDDEREDVKAIDKEINL